MMNEKIKRVKTRIGIVFLFMMSVLVLTACSSNRKKGDGEIKVEESKYGIVVMNQDGEVVSGATVALGGASATTSSTGNVSFNAFKGTTTLKVTKSGYLDYSNSAYAASKGGADVITLHSTEESNYKLKSATYICGNTQVDLLNGAKQLNTSSDLAGFQIVVAVNKGASSVKSYELHQTVTDDKGSRDVTIARSANGYFGNLNVTSFSAGTGVYIKTIDKDNVCYSTSLKLEIVEGPDLESGMSLSLGDSISFTVSDDVPLIGGSNMEMALPELPVTFEASENHIKVGINLDPEELDEDAWDDIRDTLSKASDSARTTAQDIRNIKDKIRNHSVLGSAKQPWGQAVRAMNFDKFEFGAMGYVETVVGNDGKLCQGKGYICLTLEGGAGFNWQTAVWIVPVNIDVSGTMSANFNAAIGYDFYENVLTGDASLGVEAELTLKAGVGMKNLSAGVYGSASLPFDIAIATTGGKPGLRKVELNGEVGVYADVAIWSYSKALLDGSVQIYPRQEAEKLTCSEDTLYKLSNYELSDVEKIPLVSYSGDSITDDVSNLTKIVAEAYSGSDSVAVTDGVNSILVYTEMNTDASSENYGKTQLFMSLYDEETGVFAEPQRVTDTDVYEHRPQLYYEGDAIYLVYQSNSTSPELVNGFEGLDDDGKVNIIKEYMKNMSLQVAKYDTVQKKFVSIGTVTEEGTYNYAYDFAVVNGTPAVIWISNQSGEVFGTEEENTLQYATYTNGAWNKVICAENLSAVMSVQVGEIDGKLYGAYLSDEDKDYSTTADRSLNLVAEDGTKENIKTSEIAEINIGTIPVLTGGVLHWNEDGNVKYYDITEKKETNLFAENANGFYGKYEFTENAIYYVVAENGSSNLYRKEYRGAAEGWSEGVAVTEQDGWLRNVSLLEKGNEVIFTAQQENYNLQEEMLSTSIVSAKVGKRYSLVQNGADYDPKKIKQINGVSVVEAKTYLSNKGTETLTPVITVVDANGTALAVTGDAATDVTSLEYEAEPIQSGDSAEVTVSIVLPETLSASGYKLNVTSREEIELGDTIHENPDDDSYDMALGYGDLSLELQQYNSGDYSSVIAIVENKGNVAQGGIVAITNPNNADIRLVSIAVDELQPGERQIFKKNISPDWIKNGNGAIRVEVLNCDNDLYRSNNVAYTVASANYGKYSITYKLKGGKNNSNNPSAYTTKDIITLKNPTRSGYTFEGWYTTSSYKAKSKVTTIYAGTAGNITLYAKWKSNSTTTVKGKVFKRGNIKYKITSVGNVRKVTVYGVTSKKVKKVTIPKVVKYGKYKYNVTAIRANAFKNCKKLKTITIKTTSLKKVEKNAFSGIYKKCRIRVPKKYYKKYKTLLKKKGQGKKVKIVKF